MKEYCFTRVDNHDGNDMEKIVKAVEDRTDTVYSDQERSRIYSSLLKKGTYLEESDGVSIQITRSLDRSILRYKSKAMVSMI